MNTIENKMIDEKVYTEVLENGMKIIIVPKRQTNKKYIIWGTRFGSMDNHFIDPKTNEEVQVPDGVAHYLEHKMFEQENGVDSLYKLMALGLDANAYTTNNHTAYLFGCTENFYEGLDELMDYVQHPYFTDENVEKERGIIEQEIQRYQDEPSWTLYLNCMKALYEKNGIRIDTAGTKESISKITKETLYSCYNTFYHPSNMVMVVCGDFEPEQILEDIKKRLIPREKIGEIKRIYPEKEEKVYKKKIETSMSVNMPLFMVGYRDFEIGKNTIEKNIAIHIIINSLLGKSTENFQKMYEEGLLMKELEYGYEFSSEYSHILISGETNNINEVYSRIIDLLQNGEIKREDFERGKKKFYGQCVSMFNSVEEIGRMFLQDAIENINSIDYFDSINNITYEKTLEIRDSIFKEENNVLSVVNSK